MYTDKGITALMRMRVISANLGHLTCLLAVTTLSVSGSQIMSFDEVIVNKLENQIALSWDGKYE